MVEFFETPKKTYDFLRDVHNEMVVLNASIHDEIDYVINKRLLKPILLNMNKMAELRSPFSSFKMPYLNFYFDNEYDDFGSFTASKNARVDMYAMNFNNTTSKDIKKAPMKLVVKLPSMDEAILGRLSSKSGTTLLSVEVEGKRFTNQSLLCEENIKIICEEHSLEITYE